MLQDTIGNADYDHFMTICYLFYDNPKKSDNQCVQTFKFTTIQAYDNWMTVSTSTDQTPLESL